MFFRLGPLSIEIKGEHFITKWAQDVFLPLICAEKPHLQFRFLDHPPKPPSRMVDASHHIDDTQIFAFRTRHFDIAVTQNSPMVIEIYQRDQRALWRRSLSEVDVLWKMWLGHGTSINICLLKEFAYQILPFGLQCQALLHNASLIHASSLAIDGKALLFPALGGVGKSAIVSQAMLYGRGHFLADDHAIIDAQGNSYLHLLPIHFYAYHLENDPILKKQALAACDFHRRVTWPLSKTFRHKKAVRWIDPVKVFSKEKMTPQAPLSEVILMFRVNAKDFVWQECSPQEAARICVGFTLHEIPSIASHLSIFECAWEKSSFLGTEESCKKIKEIYFHSFAKASCHRLLIPYKAKGSDLLRFLQQKSPGIESAVFRS